MDEASKATHQRDEAHTANMLSQHHNTRRLPAGQPEGSHALRAKTDQYHDAKTTEG